MPEHYERRILPYTPEQMFDLVADIEKYPEFLPWCRSVRILNRKGNRVTASLEAGSKVLNDAFTSVVTFERPTKISVSYGGGSLKRLDNEWGFAAHKDGCEVTFALAFAFRSALLGGMMSLAFDRAFRTMAAAFEERARAVYG